MTPHNARSARRQRFADTAAVISTQVGQAQHPGLALLAFFVDGLGVGDDAFVTKCADFLLGNGPKAIPLLLKSARDPETKPKVREKLLAIVEQLQLLPEDQNVEVASAVAVNALVDGLRVRNVSVHRRIREIFCGFPDGDLGNRLVREAVLQRRKPAYCARLLETAALVAHQQQPEQLLLLSSLFAQGNVRIKTAVLRLLELVRQVG